MSNISLEPLLNRQQRVIGSGYAEKVVVEGVGGTTTNRVLAMSNNAATSDSPTADCVEIHYSNNTGTTVRYGGSGVTSTTGGKMQDGTTMVFKAPRSGFTIYFLQASGGSVNLDVVEFF